MKAPLAAAAAALALAACGTSPPDLFVVHRTGTVPGARLKLLVSDNSVRCNDGRERDLTSRETLEARTIMDDLVEYQSDNEYRHRPAPGRIFEFSVRTQEGTLRFSDTSQLPRVLPRITRFTRRIAIDVCMLAR